MEPWSLGLRIMELHNSSGLFTHTFMREGKKPELLFRSSVETSSIFVFPQLLKNLILNPTRGHQSVGESWSHRYRPIHQGGLCMEWGTGDNHKAWKARAWGIPYTLSFTVYSFPSPCLQDEHMPSLLTRHPSVTGVLLQPRGARKATAAIVTALLRYKLHPTQFSHLKCTVGWFCTIFTGLVSHRHHLILGCFSATERNGRGIH